jgi:hypothetical protein
MFYNELMNKYTVVSATPTEAEARRKMPLIGVLPSLSGRMGRGRRNFYCDGSLKGCPLLTVAAGAARLQASVSSSCQYLVLVRKKLSSFKAHTASVSETKKMKNKINIQTQGDY